MGTSDQSQSKTMNEIIDNTNNAKKSFGFLYGGIEVTLSDEELTALQNGKCVALTVNDEYVVFLTAKTK